MKLTQDTLAKRVGVSRVAVTKWEDDDTIDLKGPNLLRLAEVLETTPDHIADGTPHEDPSRGQSSQGVGKVYVSRISGVKIRAGTGEFIYDFEELDNSRAFDREWMRKEGLDPPHCKLIDVDGDSMSPTLENGETILINTRDRELRHNKIFALITDDGIRVKRVLRRADGQWEIHSDNTAKHLYPTEPFVEGKTAIWGRVRWHAGTL